MKLKHIVYFAAFVWLVVTGLSSCDKFDTYDGGGNITTPFSMIVGGRAGELYTTNDGRLMNNVDFASSNGSRVYQIVVAGSNTLVNRSYLTLYNSLNKNISRVKFKDSTWEDSYNKLAYDELHDTLYFCTEAGLFKSSDSGETWSLEQNWDNGYNTQFNSGPFTFGVPPINHPAIGNPRSITITDNNDIFILCDTFIYRKAGGTQSWQYVPSAGGGMSDSAVWWVLSSYGNTLCVFDTSGYLKPKYSTNNGTTFNNFEGLPLNKKVLFMGSPRYNTNRLFCGTDSSGLFELASPGNLVPFSGMDQQSTRYYSVTGKRNTYKSGVQRYYYYMATNKGIFESESSGSDWRLITPGNYSALW